MSFSRFSRQRLVTLFLFGILFIVAYFVLEIEIKDFRFRQPLNKNINRAPNKMRRESFMAHDVQFCYYDTNLVMNNALDGKWSPIFSKCVEQRQELFYFIKGALHVNRTVLTEENLNVQKCVVSTVEWRSDNSYVIGKEILLGDLEESQSPLFISIKSDFIYINCDLRTTSSPLKDTNHKLLSGNSNIPGVSVTEDDASQSEHNSKDPALTQNGILLKYDPSLVGSLGLPDFRYGIQFQWKAREQIKRGTRSNERSPEIGNRLVEMSHKSENTKKTYSQFLVHVSEQEQTREKLAPLLKNKPAHPVNVLILVLDSISQWSFNKNLKQTKNAFEDPIVLHGFNVLGDSAIATLLPLLTGMKDEEFEDLKKRDNGGQFVSALPFIWNQFEGRGYATLYAEDQPYIGTFQNHFMGFEEPPVDHYMRPFWLATERHELGLKGKYCIGSKQKHKYILEYMKSFFDRYEDIPKFALGFISEYERTRSLDNDLRDFFESLKTNGVLKNSLTILLGDHGANHGKTRESFGGMLNERLPLALISMPDVLKFTKPEIVEMLKTHRNKLTTALDLHSTLLSLVSSPHNDGTIQTKGLSLFQEIPLERTCQSVDLSMHYCTCTKYEGITDHQDSRVSEAANNIIEQINNILLDGDGFKRCQKMFLEKIIDARFVVPNDVVRKFTPVISNLLRKINVYLHNPSLGREWLVTNFTKILPSNKFLLQVVLQASPGNALFEGTVSLEKSASGTSGHSTNLKGISRINEYKEQSRCIKKIIPSLARFCICSVGMEEQTSENTH